MYKRQDFPIVSRTSLRKISESHSLRCDSKQSERRFEELDCSLYGKEVCFLGEFLPAPLVKGTQHTYLQEGEGIPVVNTLSIQKLKINKDSCRFISEEDFFEVSDYRRLKSNDVLLTMDGGTSIGKPVLFDLPGDYTVDSHVAILRPVGISPKALVYLLASPIGQIQFQRFESGASGQTAVTEEDLRRFKIPASAIEILEAEIDRIDKERSRIEKARNALDENENKMWDDFTVKIIS